ncbi:MAG: hypothetical protein P8L85_11440 [Rubripirellula sp.]|nr:hypothetical protein [Rubripirellula sp.]
MNDDVALPASYQQWRHCIEVRCKIRLTPTYVGGRLAELQNDKDSTTSAFEKIYGTEHLQQTIAWFRRAADEFPQDGEGHRHA